MNYVDPFLQEQQRIAGMQPGSGVEQVSIDIPSLQQPQKTDLPDTVLPGPSLLDMAMAKKMKQAPSSVQPQQPSSEQMSQPVPQQSLPPQNKPPEQFMAETGQQSALDQMGKEGVKPVFQPTVQPQSQPAQSVAAQPLPQKELMQIPEGRQQTILGASAPITQKFGNRNSIEKYSGGVNYGVDIAVPRGTPLAAPPGKWKVVEAYDGASVEGPNNKEGGSNRGYGNSVLLQNADTGEKMRFSHLQVGGVGVKPGQEIEGGTVFGKTGASGNTAGRTGQHLDWEYYDKNGKIADGLQTPYAQYLLPR